MMSKEYAHIKFITKCYLMLALPKHIQFSDDRQVNYEHDLI